MGSAVVGGVACEGAPPDRTGAPAGGDDEGREPDIGERIRSRADASLGVVEQHAHSLFDRPLMPGEVSAAIGAADDLAALFGRLELPNIARLARQLAIFLSRADSTGPTAGVQVAATCEDIRALVGSEIAQQDTIRSATETVVVVGDQTDPVDILCWVARSRGYSVVRAVDDLPDLDRDPAAIIAVCPDRFTPAVASMLRAVAGHWSAPVLIVHDHADRQATQELAAFATTLLPPSASAAEITAELTRTIDAHRGEPTVMLCGRPLAAAERFFAHGFGVVDVAPSDPLPAVAGGRPGVVVFGPSVGADTVAGTSRLVRATPGLRHNPIIWVTGDGTPGSSWWIDRLDVEVVDVVDDALVSRCAGRLRRLAADYSQARHEATPMLSWAATQVLIDRVLVSAQRTAGHVAVASIRLDGAVPPERRAVLNEALGTEFRRNDVLGRRDDQTLIVALDGVPAVVAVNRLGSLLERLDLGGKVVRIGVAHFPSDGRSAVELVSAADHAAELAVDHAGPPVVSTTWRPRTDDTVDAMVVDGDPVLGHLLVELLLDDGLRAKQFNSGPDVLSELSQLGDAASPRLLLLDFDVPGIDGIAMLRKLRTAGLMAQTKVVLMTSRSSESDLKVALDIGVVEVVRKPFSATLLRHRLRTVLGDGS